MFIAPTPPFDAGMITMTAQQQADLDCLSFASTLKLESFAPFKTDEAEQMVRTYSDRLRASDPTRNWTSLTAKPSSVGYGWWMGQLGDCRAGLQDPTRRPTKAEESTRASLWVNDDQAQLHVWVEDGPTGYRLVVDCVRGCTPRVRHVQTIGDAPISLFRLWDGDGIVYSLWSGASAYRVRAWKVSYLGVSELMVASSRGRPDFLSSADGAPQVRTYEADGGTEPVHPVLWEYRSGRFSRLSGVVR